MNFYAHVLNTKLKNALSFREGINNGNCNDISSIYASGWDVANAPGNDRRGYVYLNLPYGTSDNLTGQIALCVDDTTSINLYARVKTQTGWTAWKAF